MTKIYVRESRPTARRAAGNAARPEPRDGADPAAPAAAGKPPSFLAQAKGDLTGLIAAQVEHAEYPIVEENITTFVDLLWPFVAKKLAASYWNGVRDGASGKVKPKAPRRGATAEGD